MRRLKGEPVSIGFKTTTTDIHSFIDDFTTRYGSRLGREDFREIFERELFCTLNGITFFVVGKVYIYDNRSLIVVWREGQNLRINLDGRDLTATVHTDPTCEYLIIDNEIYRSI